MRQRKNDLDNLSEDLAFGKRSNDIINRELDALPKGVKSTLDNAVNTGRRAEDQAKDANRRVDQLLENLDNNLIPKFDSIRAGSVGGLENLTRIIQQARKDTQDASKLADSADATEKRVRKQHELTKLNLKELKDKILLARQKASSIRIGLTSDAADRCVRSYSPTIEPSTTNNIVLNYATKSDAEDSMLFFIGSSSEEDFMAIEMVNRKIRFLWNVGGGTKVIVHDKEIETNNEQLLKNSQWFKIEANRIGNIGTLSVKRTPDGQKPDPFEVTGSSPAGFTKMDLDSSSNFFIGGFPDNFETPREIISSSFSGCLYEVLLDGKPVGLWNFLTNSGCDGCKEGATEDIDISAFEFQGGNSYAIVPQIPFYKKSALFADLSFKTLNEDALLFLACNNEKDHMISLELKGGKVVYQLKIGNRNHIRLETKKKYNTGQWVSVEAAREMFEAQITVQDEILDDTLKGGSSALELKDNSLYFGGVPPNFTKESWPDVTFTNFFGCMKDLQLDATPVDLSKGSFYGMNVGCSNRPMKIATFNGESYLELNGHALPMDSGISFSFMTSQTDGLLVMSTFQGQNKASSKELQNYYSIALKDGRIVAIFNSGDGEVLVTSERALSRNTLHTVNIIRKNRRLALRLDDEADSDIRLPKGAKEILSPKEGGLFFGGVKRGIDVGSMAASQQPFVGIIQDAIFNDKLLRFEDAINHKGVDFGLPPDQQFLTEEFFQQMAPSISGGSCAADLRMEDNAISHQSRKPIHIPLNKKDIVNSFNISLDYRTFYPDGNIILLSNEPKKLHLSMFLEKGKIKMHYLYKKENKTEKSNKELMIRKWHQVELQKNGKHLTVFLDMHKSLSLNVPKRLPFKSINIGGMPLSSTDLNEFQATFKGCFRNLEVNGKNKKIPSDSSCFKHVDFGTYFTGVRHVAQDHAFHLGKEVELIFEFRTAQYTGTLFSIFSRFTGVWFELSLSDNMVIATLYEAPDVKVQLSKKLKWVESCDYKWHNIQMIFRDNHFTLNVDDFRPVEQKTKDLNKDFGFAEIYIGGKPEKHPHFGQQETNFSGCLRKITLNGEGLHIKNPESDENVVQYMCPQI